MDRQNCTVYVYTNLNGLADAVKDRLPGINVKAFQDKHDHFFYISDEVLEDIRRNADVLLCAPPIIVKVLQGENKLQWAQSCSAGVDWLLQDTNVCLKNVQITKMGEGWEESMAEYVLGFIIQRERHIPEMRQAQFEKRWDSSVQSKMRLLSSLTVGILGTGQIGSHIAKILGLFGMKINGLCRHPKEISADSPFEKLWQEKGISEFLEDNDYIVNILPGTPETKDMLSGEVLKSCKTKKPYFINIGRGNIIDTITVEKAIRENWISGALLDVVNLEPLPPDHPLWNIPDVTITPHTSGVENIPEMANLFAKNLDKFLNNEPLLYTFNCNIGY